MIRRRLSSSHVLAWFVGWGSPPGVLLIQEGSINLFHNNQSRPPQNMVLPVSCQIRLNPAPRRSVRKVTLGRTISQVEFRGTKNEAR
jgi:hypothetical protein